MKLWSLAWRNLKRHLRRNLTTGCAILFGFLGVVLLGGYMMYMENYLATQGVYLTHVGHIAIYKKDGLDRHLTDPDLYSLSVEEQNKIIDAAKRLAEPPEFIARYLHGQGLVTNGCSSFPVMVTALEPDVETSVRNHPLVQHWTPELLKLKKGNGFWQAGSTPDSIAVAFRLAKLLQKPLISGDPSENKELIDQLITDCTKTEAKESLPKHSGVQFLSASYSGGLAAIDARISGHYSTGLALTDANQALMPLALAQQFYGTDKVTWISLYLKTDQWVGPIASELQKNLKAAGVDVNVYTYRDDRVNPYYVGIMNFVYVMMIFFVVLVCGVVALSILNSLQISLLERKTELGTLRAIGFRSNLVTGLFVREVTLLCLISLSLGGMFAYVVAAFVNRLNLRYDLMGTADDIQFLLKPDIRLTFAVGLVFLVVAALTCRIECKRRLKTQVVNLLETT